MSKVLRHDRVCYRNIVNAEVIMRPDTKQSCCYYLEFDYVPQCFIISSYLVTFNVVEHPQNVPFCVSVPQNVSLVTFRHQTI